MTNLYKINLTYNYNTDESKLKKSANWDGLPSIHRLDALQDFMADLQELYNETYKEHIGDYKHTIVGEETLRGMGHFKPDFNY